MFHNRQQLRQSNQQFCVQVCFAYDPVSFTRSSSDSRSRISAGRRSCTWRAPILATSTMVAGAGVATATTSQISAESAKPAKAASSKISECFGAK